MNILVAIDGSTTSEAVRHVALQVAQGHPGCTVTALHVVAVRVASGNLLQDLPGRLGFEPAVVSAEVESAHLQHGRALVSAFAQHANDKHVKVVSDLRAGAIPQVLSEVAATADLLVLGARGETEDKFPGQGGRLMGSLPADHTPILVVPKGVERLESVTIGFDGSHGARRAARVLRTVIVPMRLPIHSVFVGDEAEGQALLTELDGLLGVTTTRHVVTGVPHDAIFSTARTVGSSVVVLGFSGRSKLKDFLFGSTAERAVLQGRHAVLLAT